MYSSIYGDGSSPRSSTPAPAPAPSAASAPSSSPGSGATTTPIDGTAPRPDHSSAGTPQNPMSAIDSGTPDGGPASTPKGATATPNGMSGSSGGGAGTGAASGGHSSPLPGLSKGMPFPPIWPQSDLWDHHRGASGSGGPLFGGLRREPTSSTSGSGSALDRWRSGYDRYERKFDDGKFGTVSSAALGVGGTGGSNRDEREGAGGPASFDHNTPGAPATSGHHYSTDQREGYYDKLDPFNHKSAGPTSPSPSSASAGGVSVVDYVHPQQRPLPPRLSLFTPYYPQHQVYGHSSHPASHHHPGQPQHQQHDSPQDRPSPPPAFGLSNIHEHNSYHSLPNSLNHHLGNHLSPPNHLPSHLSSPLNHLPNHLSDPNHLNHLPNHINQHHPQSQGQAGRPGQGQVHPGQLNSHLPLHNSLHSSHGMNMPSGLFPFSAPDWPMENGGPGSGAGPSGLNPDIGQGHMNHLRPRDYQLGSAWTPSASGANSSASASAPEPDSAAAGPSGSGAGSSTGSGTRGGRRSNSTPPAVSSSIERG